MNCLNQLENGIFATEESLQELAAKDSASALVFSDTHGAEQLLELIVKNAGNKSDAFLFTGDGIYDLISIMEKSINNPEISEILPPVIAFVRGNNDPDEVSAAFSKNIYVPSKSLLKICGRKILLTHGHNENVYLSIEGLKSAARTYGADTVLYGHTHVPAEIPGAPYLLNPGSVNFPRHSAQAGFARLQISKNGISSVFYRISTLNGIHFLPYSPSEFIGW